MPEKLIDDDEEYYLGKIQAKTGEEEEEEEEIRQECEFPFRLHTAPATFTS